MANRILWYTFALIALFLVLSRFSAANQLLATGFKGYGTLTGILQGRNVSASGAISGIAR